MRDRVSQDELDHDTQQGRWAEPRPSLFDFEDEPVNELSDEQKAHLDSIVEGVK